MLAMRLLEKSQSSENLGLKKKKKKKNPLGRLLPFFFGSLFGEISPQKKKP
jgi:hypothetical protein